MFELKKPEFDFDAAIRKLAEAEWKCPDIGVDIGTGRIVPFAALRVPCQYEWHPLLDAEFPCPACNNAPWVPEPDVEKACWRIFVSVNLDYEHLHDEEAIIRAALAWLER